MAGAQERVNAESLLMVCAQVRRRCEARRQMIARARDPLALQREKYSSCLSQHSDLNQPDTKQQHLECRLRGEPVVARALIQSHSTLSYPGEPGDLRSKRISTTPVKCEFEALLDYIRLSHGFDFTGYKRSSLMRRVQHRMQMLRFSRFSDYRDYLEVHPQEGDHLVNTILINFTGFFRDASAWEYVASEIIPRIIAGKSSDEPIRVWSAGCSTGEEAYTLAILLVEALGVEQFQKRVRIFASDVDTDALTQARKGRYRHERVMGLTPHLLSQYFEQDNCYYVFRQDLRHPFVFACRNLIQDAPMTKIDLLVCRNVLIYLDMSAQIRVKTRFHFGLLDSGFLFLGMADHADIDTKLFTPVNRKHRVEAKVPGAHRDRLLLPKAFRNSRSGEPFHRQLATKN